MFQKIKKNIPNTITIFRILLIPFIICIFQYDNKWSNFFCCTLFIMASFSDFLDGYLARKFHVISELGSTLDHVSDKLLIIMIIVIIIEKTSSKFICIPSLIIIVREIVVLSIREIIAKSKHWGKNNEIDTSFFFLGKVKTCTQMVAIIILLIYDVNYPNYISWLGFIFFYLSAFITFYSMILYVVEVHKQIKK